MTPATIPPDLQAALLCEDVRSEVNGTQTLVGVLGVLPTPTLPVGFFKLCLWTRWCGGTGRFRQAARLLDPDDEKVAEAAIDFELREMEASATNVHFFGGLQIHKFGLHHVEVDLDGRLHLRFPWPVIQIQPPPGGHPPFPGAFLPPPEAR